MSSALMAGASLLAGADCGKPTRNAQGFARKRRSASGNASIYAMVLLIRPIKLDRPSKIGGKRRLAWRQCA